MADSLFDAKKYHLSSIYYDSVFSKNMISPDMLLKMAYIREGMGDYTKALYYLNTYQLNYPNSLVLKKMDALGSKHNLIGYEFTDYEYFSSLFNKFRDQIFYVIFGVSAVIFLYTAIRVYYGEKYKRVRYYWVFLIVLLSYAFVNFGIPSYKGIIIQDRTFLMDAPAYGSRKVAVLNRGNRLNILDKDEVWYEVLWDGGTAFIKRNHMITVENSKNVEQFNLVSFMYNAAKTFYVNTKRWLHDMAELSE